VIRDGYAVKRTERSLTSTQPPGFPADYAALTLRSQDTSQFTGIEFGNVAKVTELVNNFSVSMWMRPYDLTTDITVPIYTGLGTARGWKLLGTCRTGPWPTNAIGFVSVIDDYESLRVTNGVMAVGQWNLVSFAFSSSYVNKIRIFLNGIRLGIVWDQYSDIPTPGDRLTIGTYDFAGTTYQPRSDIGPVMIWGSVLTDEDMALLYRDTWGMVSPQRQLRVFNASSSSGSRGRRAMLLKNIVTRIT
jgi:hypothetical protein